jgi:hypothetical protein
MQELVVYVPGQHVVAIPPLPQVLTQRFIVIVLQQQVEGQHPLLPLNLK